MVELRTAATVVVVVVVLETPTAMRVVEKYARSKFEDEKQHFRVKKKKRGDKVLTKQAVPQEDGKICWQIPLTALVVTVSIHTHTHTQRFFPKGCYDVDDG